MLSPDLGHRERSKRREGRKPPGKFRALKHASNFFAISSLAGLLIISLTWFSPVKREIMAGRRINILFLGINEFDNARHCEVINILSYEPTTGFIDIVSIPGDTMISVPYEVTWRRIQRLDEIYSRFYREHNGDAEKIFLSMREVLDEFLEKRIAIEHYIQVDHRAITGFVDALGGVTVEVIDEIKYEDRAQGLSIDISTGMKHFSGSQALDYVRFRERIRGGIEQQQRRRRFMQAVLKRLRSPSAILRIPGLARAILDNVETSLSAPDILALADELRNSRLTNYRAQILDGEQLTRWGRSYWSVNRERMRDMIDVAVNSQLLNLPPAPADRKAAASRRITAEVWNATDRPGLARDLTEYLRRRNVDVVRYGNFGAFRRHTQIISRTGDLNTAREVANILGCRNIVTDVDTGRMVDINVVIGSDIAELWSE